MLSVADAIAAVLREVAPFAPVTVPLAEALGLVLAEDAVSDVDSPPFDKSLMDGYAVRAADVAAPGALLTVIEEVTAGRVPTKPVGRGEATRIMTGAPIPAGSDAVVRLEDTEAHSSGRVRIEKGPTARRANVMGRGVSFKRGDVIVPAGKMLRPQELGALAELGKSQVAVRRRPQVAVLATGDELVSVHQVPGPGQIRNANETMLVAQVRMAGAEALALGIARDGRDHLRERLLAGLTHDMLILSGGVSAGKLDLVPSELEAAGVSQFFHHVHFKPGKPIWYGVLDRGPAQEKEGAPGRCHVFGLPGNPVSSMVCFELFVRTALRRQMGYVHAEPKPLRARLAVAHKVRGDRPTYHPARLEWRDGEAIVEPVAWQGSADLSATVDANAMVLFASGDKTYARGDQVDVFVWNSND